MPWSERLVGIKLVIIAGIVGTNEGCCGVVVEICELFEIGARRLVAFTEEAKRNAREWVEVELVVSEGAAVEGCGKLLEFSYLWNPGDHR